MISISYNCPLLTPLDPTETVRRKIIGEDIPTVAPLKIYGEEGKEQLSLSPSQIPLPSPTASEISLLESLPDVPSSSEAFESPPDEPLPSRQAKRWAPYPTSLFQWGILPVSQVYVPLSSLDPQPPPVGVSPKNTSINQPSQPTALIGKSQTFTRERKEIWERIIRGESITQKTHLLPPNLPWRDPKLWSSNFWHRDAGASSVDISAARLVRPLSSPPPASPDGGSVEMDVSDSD